MSSKFCKNQMYSSYILGFFITKLYTIFYYLNYFLLFSKVTYYFVWRNLPTNSNYFTKIYLLFSVTLIIIHLYKNLNRLSFTTFFLIFYLSYFGGYSYQLITNLKKANTKWIALLTNEWITFRNLYTEWQNGWFWVCSRAVASARWSRCFKIDRAKAIGFVVRGRKVYLGLRQWTRTWGSRKRAWGGRKWSSSQTVNDITVRIRHL